METQYKIHNRHTSHSPFWIIIICLIINMVSFFICYRMVSILETQFKEFVFNHKNKAMQYHPLYEDILVRIESIENDVHTLKNTIIDP